MALSYKFPSCTAVTLFDDVTDAHPFLAWLESLARG